MKCEFKHGFYWWYDPNRKDWFVGPSPLVGAPSWAASTKVVA